MEDAMELVRSRHGALYRVIIILAELARIIQATGRYPVQEEINEGLVMPSYGRRLSFVEILTVP